MGKLNRPLIAGTGVLGVLTAVVSSGLGHVTASLATKVVLAVSTAVCGLFAMIAAAARGQAQELVDDLARLLRLRTTQRFTRYGAEYRRVLQYDMMHMDTARLGRTDLITTMDEVYIDLELSPYVTDFLVPTDLLSDVTDASGAAVRYPIWEFLEREQSVVVAVLGRPGSGKTTLLRNVVLRMAEGDPRTRRRTVPAYVKLGELAARIAGGADDPRLAEVLRENAPTMDVKEPEGWWERQLSQGSCVVMLDGLDEVADGRRRAALGEWIHKQIGLNRDNHFVISSRPGGFQASGVKADVQVQIRPLTPAQVESFLEAWYGAIERKAAGGSTPRSVQAAHENAADLLARLNRAPALYELTVNPMLLTLIAGVHSLRKRLPDNRAELYRQVFEVSLKDRTAAGDRLEVDEQIKVLDVLAYAMMQARVRVIARGRVLELLGAELAKRPTALTAERFLENLGTDGIVIERESFEREYEFTHLTFQEYLAGAHLRRTGAADRLEALVADRWWRETILLYATWNRPDPIVAACLATGSIDAYSLAFDCAEDVYGRPPLEPALQEKLDVTVDTAFEPDADAERRRFAAAVLASRQLRYFVYSPAGARVCRLPVTAALYALFLADTGNPGPDGRTPVRSRSQDPVLGVWESDAYRFVEWLNGLSARSVGGTEYRLPTVRELDYVAARPAEAGSSLAGGAPEPLVKGVDAAWALAEPERLVTGMWASPHITAPYRILFDDVLIAALADVEDPESMIAFQMTLVGAILVANELVRALESPNPNPPGSAAARDRREKARGLVRTIDLLRGLNRRTVTSLDAQLNVRPDRQRELMLSALLKRTEPISQSLDMLIVNAAEVAQSQGTSAYTRALHNAQILVRGLDELRGRFDGSVFSRVMAFDQPHPELRAGGIIGHMFRTFTAASTSGNPNYARLVEPLARPVLSVDVSLDRVAERVRRTRQDVAQAAKSASTWAVAASQALAEVALPVFVRAAPLDAETAAAIRFAALVLAADQHEGWTASDSATIAAAVTVLERRQAGFVPLEALVLARS